MKRIKLTIAYDGQKYSGWQIQNNANTIQAEIEKACQNLFSQEIKVIGASRTDTGVHALGQVATFDIDTSIPDKKIAYALNARLPEDIVVQESKEVHNSFQPRYHAIKKTYHYHIINNEFILPQYRAYNHFVSRKLDINKMQEATKLFIGEKDFKSFCSANSSVKTTIRTIYALEVEQKAPFLTIKVTGNGFLYNMVRIIAGTLIDVGLNRLSIQEVDEIIKSKNRAKASPTAPAKGLTLVKIYYGGKDDES
ncbi:tRNA pseudouridine38-40 synthase [Natranaerovirga hydrolytica]|uniref:tRNA pseudouridine synthase A n=1 Tax=Natranaerovirga hydrolytica TaxID=680378 RepID=A0A4R1MLG0_9FIRM|nr:tRNA pseudouridine(38-40) synthase TruA [Natranaerovirga hydrolytica]TCK93447.1 tRNA pseudouridine38-40 synthase [Natranaerovirga hydrolytica]